MSLSVAGVSLHADPAGALYWPEQGLLAVADLHLEKGSSFAARGQLLPPYDTAATLARLARLVARYAPRCVVALGDSFHDGGGPARLADSDRELLRWPAARPRLDLDHRQSRSRACREYRRRVRGTLAIGALTFRHLPSGAEGEIAGHLHPVCARAQPRPHGLPAAASPPTPNAW